MGFSASIHLPDPDATDRLGQRLAALLKPGDVVFLDGQIGAGKTHLARSIIQSMMRLADHPAPDVPSPTYTLVQTYDLPDHQLWHVDLYRLTDPGEVFELGLEDAFGTDIVLVEWPDRLENAPSDALSIAFAVEDPGRRLTLRSASDRWQALQELGEPSDA